ncbi:MAG: hypothetical protein CL609_21155 [Anaerolineaceae bacterium]|nr:hypothetical protein [Anaerolineaceae bacterium]
MYDMALDPSIPVFVGGLVSGWIWTPGQSGKNYIQTVEGGNPKSHARDKHGPDATDADLISAARNSSKAQTRFSDENEMAAVVNNVLTTNQADIANRANAGKPGTFDYTGSTVNYTGWQNVSGTIVPVSGKAPAKVVIWYDGNGNWGLYTTYPIP